MIERIVGFAESLDLVGIGGIGKTSITLTVLHHNRTKQRFSDDRRFIRYDEFPPSRANFVHRLSKVIGIGVKNPENLSSLRPLLSSKEIVSILDNAELILDPQGDRAQGIYGAVEELSQLKKIRLIVTSRITIIPPDCETFEVPSLSIEAVRDTFHHIYKHHEQPGSLDGILQQLDFHPFSVTLLATAAQQNRWNGDRLSKEWEQRQTSVPHARHKSQAATIELSLVSPTFRGPGGSRESSPFFHEVSARRTFTGYSLPSPTEILSSPSSAFFP